MKLVKYPDPWLEKKVSKFNFDDLDAKKIESDMIELMLSEGGIGLSANQIALDAQVFVIKPFVNEIKKPFAVINPEILAATNEMDSGPEGCLSHPDLYLSVKRPKGLRAKFVDSDGNERIIDFYDIDARCFLHEYDHLQGIQFINRVSKIKLHMAEKKRKKFNRRK